MHRFRSLASRLIVAVNCIADNYEGERRTFGDSMVMCTASELKQYVEETGWKIQFTQNRRFQSLRTFIFWKQNLDRIYGDSQPPGQLGYLRNHVNAALRSPASWCECFPLIDIVAD